MLEAAQVKRKIEVVVHHTDLDLAVDLPTLAEQTLLYVQTDLPCLFRKADEPQPARELGVDGTYVEIGGAPSRSLLFTGVAAASQVYIYIAGN